MNEIATEFDQEAQRAEAAARSGESDAADPATSPAIRGCAARAAESARSRAVECREIADELRAGSIPENVRLTD